MKETKKKKPNQKYKKRKSLKKQMKDRLNSLRRIGESRHEAKKDYRETIGNGKHEMNRTVGIHSLKTFDNYLDVTMKFVDYLRAEFPEVKDLEQITKEHCVSYIKHRVYEEQKKATTYSRDISALNKVFRYELTKEEMGLDRKDFDSYTNNRELKAHHKKINLDNYKNEVLLIKATGIRRASVTKVKPKDFVWLDNEVIGVTVKEKGGKIRTATVLERYREELGTYLKGLDEDKVIFEKIPNRLPTHRLRQYYAQNLYKQLVADEVMYNFRKTGETYLAFDTGIVKEVSENLGHSRVEIIKHYLNVDNALDID